MKAIQVSYSNITHKYRAKAEGVPAITRSKETLTPNLEALDIARQLANKYNWLEDKRYWLAQGSLPNGDDVFIFVKDVHPLLDEVEYILSIDYDSQNRNLELCKDTVDTLRETYEKYTSG